jgi:hypothetical protein
VPPPAALPVSRCDYHSGPVYSALARRSSTVASPLCAPDVSRSSPHGLLFLWLSQERLTATDARVSGGVVSVAVRMRG